MSCLDTILLLRNQFSPMSATLTISATLRVRSNLSITFGISYAVANLWNDGHIKSRDTAGGMATILKDGASCKPCNLHPRKGKAVKKTRTNTTTHVWFPLAEPSSPIRYHTTHGLRTPCRSLPGLYRVSLIHKLQMFLESNLLYPTTHRLWKKNLLRNPME